MAEVHEGGQSVRCLELKVIGTRQDLFYDYKSEETRIDRQVQKSDHRSSAPFHFVKFAMHSPDILALSARQVPCRLSTSEKIEFFPPNFPLFSLKMSASRKIKHQVSFNEDAIIVSELLSDVQITQMSTCLSVRKSLQLDSRHRGESKVEKGN